MNYISYTLICLSVIGQQLLASTAVELTKINQETDLTPYIQLLEDKHAEYSFNDVLERYQDQFTPSKGSANFGFTQSAWWVKLSINNFSEQQTTTFIRQNYQQIDHIEFWKQINNEWKVIHTGDRLIHSSRPINTRDFTFPVQLDAQSSKTIYIRFSTQGAMNIGLSITNTESLIFNTSSEQLFFGIYYGGFIVLVIYNLFLFLSIKEKAFIYYLLYLISYGLYMSVHNGLSFQYLWPNSPNWHNQSLLVLLSLSLVFSVQFMREILDTKTDLIWADRISKFLIVFSGVLFFVCFFISYKTVIFLISIATLAATIIIMAVGIVRFWQKHPASLYFLSAWTILLLGVIIYMLKTFGYLPHNAFTQNSFQLGSLIEMLLLSLAIGDRVKQLKMKAFIDPLTRCFNRRFFEDQCESLFIKSYTQNVPLSLLMIDVDYFKNINDSSGHLVGDNILKAITEELKLGLDDANQLFRYGGEEFAILLKDTELSDALVIAERLRSLIEQRSILGHRVTISVGASEVQSGKHFSVQELQKAADKALYHAKYTGRNKVCSVLNILATE